MSSEFDRNPSPPPEILNEEFLPDKIGDTMYSKRWTIKTLMNIIEACNKSKEIDSPLETNSKDIDETSSDIVELDPKLEEDVCTLWDMSASKEVADFLLESGICEIFQDVIDTTKSPRLLEIALGILGNLCTFNDICRTITNKETLLYSILLLSGTTDTPSLIQVFRLIMCGLKNENCQKIWFDAFEKHPFFMNNIKDILLNILNGTVIITTYQLLSTILTLNICYCQFWGEHPFLESFFIAGQQLFKLGACLDMFFYVLSLLCQYTPNIKKIAEKWTELEPLFLAFCINLGKDECLFDSERLTSVCSYFETYHILLSSENIKKDSILPGSSYLISLAKVLGAVNLLISNIKKDNPESIDMQNSDKENPSDLLRRVEDRKGKECVTMISQEEFNSWQVLAETVTDVVKILEMFVEKDEDKKIINDMLSGIVQENVDSLII